MHFGTGSARDLPELPSFEADALRFGRPVFGLRAQPSLIELGHGTIGTGGTLGSVSRSYGYLAHPDRPEDPANFRDGAATYEQGLQKAIAARRPEWLLRRIRMGRYPSIWEAVVTERSDYAPGESLAERLAHHMNHVAINTLDGRRRGGVDGPPTLDAPVPARATQDAALTIDGATVSAISIDTDPDVVGWAATVDDSVVLLVLHREWSDRIDLELVSQ